MIPEALRINKSKIIIINKGRTKYDHVATVKIDDSISRVLPLLVEDNNTK